MEFTSAWMDVFVVRVRRILSRRKRREAVSATFRAPLVRTKGLTLRSLGITEFLMQRTKKVRWLEKRASFILQRSYLRMSLRAVRPYADSIEMKGLFIAVV